MAAMSLSELEVLVDVTGKLGANLMTGNVPMNGAFDECFDHNFTSFCLALNINVTFKFIRTPPSLSFVIGLCVPRYCTGADVALAINFTEILVASQATITCTNSKMPHMSAGAIVMVAVTMIFLTLVVSGTILDRLLSEVSCKKDSTDSINGAEEKLVLLEKEKSKSKSKCSGVSPLDFVTAFSLFQTIPTLLATKQGPSVITCLNGLRVISMTWVILLHSYMFRLRNVDNLSMMESVLSRFSFQAVENALFCVDSFFFLSGLLVPYHSLREMGRLDGHFPFFHFYVHRYLRLTPTLVFVLFFGWFLIGHLPHGPFSKSLSDPSTTSCSKYWWTNLLYINNLYPWKFKDECMRWTWYLANDMQFYIISPLILFSLYHWFPVGVVIVGVFLVMGFAITASLSAVYDYQASAFSILAYNYTNKPGAPIVYADAIYIKPWSRISPYLVGLTIGYVLYMSYRLNVRKSIGVVINSSMWAVAAFVAMWLVYGLYFIWQRRPSTVENVIYITFSRFLWGCCLAVVVLACHNGYGWLVNSFLSMKLWTPLARMTFCACLVHPWVITVVYGQLQSPFHYTDLSLACYFVFFVVISYAVAYVLCVVVEFPLGTIEMLVFRLFVSKGRESRRQEQLIKDGSGVGLERFNRDSESDRE